MKQYYTTQITETKSIRMPMINSMEPQLALALGSLLGSINHQVKVRIDARAEQYLGLIMAFLVEGEEIDLGSDEVSNIIKMTCGDVISSVFASLDQLDAVIDGAVNDSEPSVNSEPEAVDSEPSVD